LNPMLQLWALAHAGVYRMVELRFPIQVFFPALILAWASALRRVLRPAAAAALVLVLHVVNSSAELARMALADPMVALGLFVAVDAALRWAKSDDARWLRLCGLALAFLAWSKNEGALYALAFLCAGALVWIATPKAVRRPVPRALAWCALPLAII